MKILVTGASGFVGKNLVKFLKCIRDGKDSVHKINGLEKSDDLKIYEFDKDNSAEELDEFCKDCDFVFNLAGVNRTPDNSEFTRGNFDFANTLLDNLRKHKNTCPVMLSSSIQASLAGRYAESDYGKSKLAGENLFFDYAAETGARVLVYRFPNIFGKWCRPNYNSVIATFCNNIANDLPIKINDENTDLELLYIDDLLKEMIAAINGNEHRCDFNGTEIIENKNGKYCFAPTVYKAKLGEIAKLLYSFNEQPKTLLLLEIPDNSFEKKLYSTYLSYLPKEKIFYPVKMNIDERGSFTELLKTEKCGQFSVNISKPGVTKGRHWHNSKWEFFIVVSGHGLIRERKIGTDEIMEFEVSGEKLEVGHMLPGYSHEIINLSDTENLVTVIWANERFDPDDPDTFFEPV